LIECKCTLVFTDYCVDGMCIVYVGYRRSTERE